MALNEQRHTFVGRINLQVTASTVRERATLPHQIIDLRVGAIGVMVKQHQTPRPTLYRELCRFLGRGVPPASETRDLIVVVRGVVNEQRNVVKRLDNAGAPGRNCGIGIAVRQFVVGSERERRTARIIDTKDRGATVVPRVKAVHDTSVANLHRCSHIARLDAQSIVEHRHRDKERWREHGFHQLMQLFARCVAAPQYNLMRVRAQRMEVRQADDVIEVLVRQEQMNNLDVQWRRVFFLIALELHTQCTNAGAGIKNNALTVG